MVRKLRAAGVPLDVIHLDTFWFERDWYCDLQFDADRFPDPKEFISELGELGVQLSLWQLPYLYGSAISCVQRSLPMARALVIEF